MDPTTIAASVNGAVTVALCIVTVAFLFYSHHIGTLARQKAMSSDYYQLLAAFLWFASWVCSSVVRFVLASRVHHEEPWAAEILAHILFLVCLALAATAIDVLVKRSSKARILVARPSKTRMFNGIQIPA